jgi:hypothetical protein
MYADERHPREVCTRVGLVEERVVDNIECVQVLRARRQVTDSG